MISVTAVQVTRSLTPEKLPDLALGVLRGIPGEIHDHPRQAVPVLVAAAAVCPPAGVTMEAGVGINDVWHRTWDS